jgi:hypothetical protein
MVSRPQLQYVEYVLERGRANEYAILDTQIIPIKLVVSGLLTVAWCGIFGVYHKCSSTFWVSPC